MGVQKRLSSRLVRSSKRRIKPPAVSETLATRRRLLMLTLLIANLFFLAVIKMQIAERAVQFSANLNEAMQTSLAYFWSTGPPKVGIQVGHLNTQNHPDELRNLRYNTGGQAGDVYEVDINLAVAQMLHDMLEVEGISAEVLPATVQPNYKADIFLSIHADSSPEPERRGYKSAHFRTPRNSNEPSLKGHIDKAYFYFTGLPDDDENVSGSMLEYYAFNRSKYRHAVSSKTPSLIVELGYISNPDDLRMISDPVYPAYALKMGIIDYLKEQGRLLN